MRTNDTVCRSIGLAAVLLGGIFLSACADDVDIRPVVPGVWHDSFTKCLAYSMSNSVPMVLFVGAADCGSCKQVDELIGSDVRFLNWKLAHPDFIYCSQKGKSKDSIAVYLGNPRKYASAVSDELAAALDFTNGSVLPRVALYWPSHTPDEKRSFSCWKGYMPIKVPKDDVIGQFVACLDEFFAEYASITTFVAGETAGNRLEVLASATFVDVPIKRTGGISRTNSTSLVMSALAATNLIEWTTGQDRAIVRVRLPEYLSVGDEIALEALGEDNAVQDRSVCKVVDPSGCTTRNPLWLGERDATTLRPGEWTMDCDLALSCARTDRSFVLNLVAGSLWCPDCVKTDRNFIETDVFRSWLEAKGVYCAEIDIPRLSSNGHTCLLTYDAASASDGYVRALTDGTDIVSEEMRMQSGTGYLSRKGISAVDAEAVLARNVALATNLVADGGLCPPGKARLGVPTFVVQNADGRIIGRFDRFASASPTNAASAAAYVRRLDEILALKDDPTEELNGHWSTATVDKCALGIRGGTVASTVSAVDLSDYWRLSGRDRWTRAAFSIRARSGETSGTNVTLNLWKVSDGKAEKVASQSGNIASGVSLPPQEVSADRSVDWFVQIEAAASSETFAIDRDGDSVVWYDLAVESVDASGEVAFAKASGVVSEADAKRAGGILRVLVPVVRTGGASGATNVTVTIGTESTAMPDRYSVVADTVHWDDGEQGVKNVEVAVYDDGNADGTQSLVLWIGSSSFTLEIVDNDKANAGKLAFAEAEPAMAKKGVIIAQEGTRVRIGVARQDGASGDVACSVTASSGMFSGASEFAWASRASGVQWTELVLPMRSECASGKVTLSFDVLDGIKADPSARTLTVQLVDADAPRFAEASRSFDVVRYCAVSQTVAVLGVADGGRAKVAKLSGSLPSGIKVNLSGDAFVVSGVPTARGGVYEAVYQVLQTVGHRMQSGLTVRLTFNVTDLATLDPSAPGANLSIASRRTIPDIMLIDEENKRLVGIVSGLTVVPTGKCSAKYWCSEGTVSLSSRNWSGYDAETGTLTAVLTASRKSHSLTVMAFDDGNIEVSLSDPTFGDTLIGAAPAAWSKANPATEWIGSCTAAFADADGEALASGAPVITLQMSSSNARSGTMRYSGILPNGQTFSGSSVLVADGVDAALLPIYCRTGKSLMTAVLRIKANSATRAVGIPNDGVRPWWTFSEVVPEASSEVRYGTVAGSWISANANLLDTVDPAATGHDLVAIGAVGGIAVDISEKAVKLDAAAAKGIAAKLSLNRKTGLVSGSFRTLNAAGKTVTATYRGVMLPDWGDGCPTCGGVPWAMGAYWFTEKVIGEANGRPKTLNVKVGDMLYIEAK